MSLSYGGCAAMAGVLELISKFWLQQHSRSNFGSAGPTNSSDTESDTLISGCKWAMAVIDLLGASITSLDQIRGSGFRVDLQTPALRSLWEDFATKLVMVIRESGSSSTSGIQASELLPHFHTV